MINPKQRAFLKSLSHSMEEKRELIKIKILNNNLDDNKETVDLVLQKTRAEFVQHIGNKFVIYRRKRKDENRIELPE